MCRAGHADCVTVTARVRDDAVASA